MNWGSFTVHLQVVNSYLSFKSFALGIILLLCFLKILTAAGTVQDPLYVEVFSTCKVEDDSLYVSLVAIRTWLSLSAVQRVTIFQRDYESCAPFLSFFKEPKFQCIVLNQSTKRPMIQVDELFDAASKYTVTPYVGYINCDIAVHPEFDAIIRNVLSVDRASNKVILGRRRDVLFSKDSLHLLVKSISIFRENEFKQGQLHGSFGKDYFIFPRNMLEDFPPFLIGRPKWDDWFLTRLLLTDPTTLSIYRLEDNIPMVHIQTSTLTQSHEKPDAHENEELFDRIWKCQPISDILNVETMIVRAEGTEEESYQMLESFPNDPLQLLFARKSRCNDTLYLYEDLSFGAEFAVSHRKILESCTQCIHIVHTVTACIYCRRYAAACICMHDPKTSVRQYLQRQRPVFNQQVEQVELFRRRFYILSTAVENGYKISYQIGGRLPRSTLDIFDKHTEDLFYTNGLLQALISSYKFPPSQYEYIIMKPCEVARDFLTILHICISKFASSRWEKERPKESLKQLQWTRAFQKCVESLG